MSQVNQRIRLIRPNARNKIQQNLQPLKQNTKKQVAQTIYYMKHPEHESPLSRAEKEPVHERLGVKSIRLRRLVPLGTNTASVLPKRRLKFSKPHVNNKVQNTPHHFKKQKLHRHYSAQARIERIRAQNNNSIIKLRRLNGGNPLVTNLTVEVKNPNFIDSGVPKFKIVLDPQIQAEIMEIQRESQSIVVIPPSTRITPVATAIGTSDRFSML